MPTEGQVLMVELELGEEPLIQIMDAAEELGNRVSKLSSDEPRRLATVEQVGSYITVVEYSDWLRTIASDLLQFQIRSRLEPLSPDVKSATLKAWASGNAGSHLRRLEGLYMRSRTNGELTKEITSHRAKIAQNLLTIQRGLKTFDVDETSFIWPILCVKADDRSIEVGSEVASDTSAEVDTSSEPDRSKNIRPSLIPGPDAPIQKSEPSDYVKWIAGYILVVGKFPRPTWEEVAKKISIKNALDAPLLPRSFRKRMNGASFPLSLFDFIEHEDNERTKQIRMGHSKKGLIDFKDRFIHSFSDALNYVGLARKQTTRSGS